MFDDSHFPMEIHDKPTKFEEMLAQTMAVPMTPSARADILLAADGTAPNDTSGSAVNSDDQ